jgi:large subunit ribosomal protein L10
MKKIGLIVKETSERNIKNNLKDSESIFIVKYSGLSSPDLTTLRQALSDSKARLFVVKNTVARRALKENGLETIVKSIEGPCGLIFVKEEPVNASKVLYNFAKDHENLKLEGGFLEDRVLDKKDIEALAKLPSKEMLRAQVVGGLKSPITGVVMVLHRTLKKFVYCLDQVKQKKGS